MLLCDVDCVAENQSCSETFHIYTYNFFQDFHMAEYHVGDTY